MRLKTASMRGKDKGTGGLALETALYAVAGILSAATGVLHLLAARDHLDHFPIAALFVAVALAQIAWGAEAALRRRAGLLLVGAAMNLALVATWAMSRTTGIPFVEMVSEREAVGIADVTATMFEVVLIGLIGLLAVLPDAARTARIAPPRAQRLVAGAGTLALLLLVPPFLTQGHGHAHGDGGHDDTHVLGSDLANGAGHDAGHGHAATAANGAVAHTDDPGHTDGHAGEHTAASAPSTHAHGGAHVAGTTEAAGHAAGGHPHEEGADHTAAGDHADHGDHPTTQRPTGPPPPEPAGQASSVRYGPFWLPPVDSGGDAHYNRIIPVPAPCVNCRITSMQPDLVFADGRSANLDSGPMLHHAVLADPWRNDPTCGRDIGVGGFGHRMFAAGNERTRMIMPAGFGVPNNSPMWMGIFEIMNDAPTNQLVFFDLKITSVPMSDASTKDVTPLWLDVDNCQDSQFSIPKGESHTLWKWKSSITGRIISAGGHVHDGGLYLTLSNSSTGQRMCTSWAGYGKKPEYMGSIESMSTCQQDRIGVVRAGEDLQIDTYYNSSQAHDDVMGILMAFVHETDDLDAGSPPPAAYTQAPPRSMPPPSSGGHSH